MSSLTPRRFNLIFIDADCVSRLESVSVDWWHHGIVRITPVWQDKFTDVEESLVKQ